MLKHLGLCTVMIGLAGCAGAASKAAAVPAAVPLQDARGPLSRSQDEVSGGLQPGGTWEWKVNSDYTSQSPFFDTCTNDTVTLIGVGHLVEYFDLTQTSTSTTYTGTITSRGHVNFEGVKGIGTSGRTYEVVEADNEHGQTIDTFSIAPGTASGSESYSSNEVLRYALHTSGAKNDFYFDVNSIANTLFSYTVTGSTYTWSFTEDGPNRTTSAEGCR